MPADPRLNSAASRRTLRTLSSEQEAEIKRARGDISCAECKRLKLKCDKTVPCAACVRRGCSSVCPNGTLAPRRPARPASSTETLQQTISDMRQRIGQLENALASLQSRLSAETHPLLQDELLLVKRGGLEEAPTESADSSSTNQISESMDAFGTLTIGDSGEVKYFGRSAGSETLLLAGGEFETAALKIEVKSSTEAESLKRLASLFPMGSGCMTDPETFQLSMNNLYACLPLQRRAWSLFETYLEHASWVIRPLDRLQIVENLLVPIYNTKKELDNAGCETMPHISPPKIAVLFLIFAQGALMDLTLSPYSEEAEDYHTCARAALTLRSIFDSPSIETVQAVLLMSYYQCNAGDRYTQDSVWTLVSLSCILSHSIGMHRDPARWDLDVKTAERRRLLFWELYTADLFHSLALGRPPSIRLSYVDCAFPQDQEDPGSEFWNWKRQFTRDIFGSVIELTLSATPPAYATILELDRKIRESALSPSLNVFVKGKAESLTPTAFVIRGLLTKFRCITLLYIHRSFFAQALLDHPENPLLSVYAPSFLAAYRRWTAWTHLFSAAIIVGSVVTRAPSSDLASTAFVELGLAIDLFQKGANHSQHSRRARTGTEKAAHMLSRRNSTMDPPPNSQAFGKHDDGTDELALFGGQTRVLVSKSLPQKYDPTQPIHLHTSSVGHLANSEHASQSNSQQEDVNMRNVPSSLLQYIDLFPPPAFTAELAPEPDLNPDLNGQSQSLNGIPLDGVSQFTHAYTNAQVSDYSDTQRRADASISPSQYQASTEFAYDPALFDPSQHEFQENFFTNTCAPDALGRDDYLELGMMMNGDSGMDEQWLAFMRDSGLMDPGTNTAP
ncbi:hypothetical protein FIBSPDRAFT_924875 [Athelia psychrophila]|uniref:Zn(2)-C6 fungal-type domain-containing protein n=1 Tax=Athelia psychrophila TaxID=1759441 RepID=A0A166VLP9_9AGAM|nr:hypothetical protein FIBSPDRAFT_924875 [Fibularhizoctonia sp. CBS 109695]